MAVRPLEYTQEKLDEIEAYIKKLEDQFNYLEACERICAIPDFSIILNSIKKDNDERKQLAASLTNVTMGRQLHEDDVLYTVLSEHDFRILKEYKQFLTADEKQVLKEIAQIMREQNPVWGV